MISKLLNIPYSQELVNEISNFRKKSAEYTKEIIRKKDVDYNEILCNRR